LPHDLSDGILSRVTVDSTAVNDNSALLAGLNAPQQEAVTHGEGPLLILAGAGSGKTRVITHRIAWLVANGLSPRRILAVTFTNKAAGEMKGRVRDLVGAMGEHIWVSTFHSFAARLLRFEADAAGLPRDFSIYDDGDRRNLLKRIIAELNLPSRTFTHGSVGSRISKAKDEMQDPNQFANLAKDDYDRRVAEIYAEYQRQLDEAGAVDFDDLLLRTVATLNDHERVRAQWQNRFEHVLVDEYQDTNLVQARMVELLAAPQNNVCVVGDDDQSIYAWRGADIRNILNFTAHFPEAHTIRLEQNYRSRPNILEAAHAVVASNRNRHPKKLWTDKPPGDKITLILSPDDRTEAEMVVGRVRTLCERDALNGGNFVILYRTNAQSRAFEEALRRHTLPYVLVGGTKFYQRAEIKDVLAYAQLTLNPNDGVALHRIINQPKRGIGAASLVKLEEARKSAGRNWLVFLGDSDAVAATVGPRPAKAIAGFVELIETIKAARTTMTLADWCRYLVESVGLKEAWNQEDPVTAVTRGENIDELIAAVGEYEINSETPSLAGFLEQAALVTDIDMYDAKLDAVTLMTLHAAKGLEFPVVFVTGLEEGLFPLSRSMERFEDLEEERRLFYVGATRAKERLFLTYSRTRRRFGPVASMKSRFIEEIPQDYLDIENLIPEIELDGSGLGYDAPGRTWRTGFRQSQNRGRAVGRLGAAPQVPRLGIADAIQAGSIVRHPQFGEGEILSLTGSGDGTTCEIAFRTGFTKTIMIRYAPLEILQP